MTDWREWPQWIGLAEVVPIREENFFDLSMDKGAFVWTVGRGLDRESFYGAVLVAADEGGTRLVGLEDIELFTSDLRMRISEERPGMTEEVLNDLHECETKTLVVFLTMDVFPLSEDENDSDDL